MYEGQAKVFPHEAESQKVQDQLEKQDIQQVLEVSKRKILKVRLEIAELFLHKFYFARPARPFALNQTAFYEVLDHSAHFGLG